MSQALSLNNDQLHPVFIAALEKAWCRETCWDGCSDQYSDDNPAWGNCLVSTLAVWASRGFKDTIMPGLALYLNQPTWHFRLMDLGTPIDPTWQQFREGTYFQTLPAGLPMHRVVVQGSIFNPAENTRLRERLALLITRMKNLEDYDLGCDADYIVGRAEQFFATSANPHPALRNS